MKTKTSVEEDRAAFDVASGKQRANRARWIVFAILAWGTLYGTASQMWDSKALAHVIAETLGDLLLLMALALALTTPWTRSQREALWHRQERRRRHGAK